MRVVVEFFFHSTLNKLKNILYFIYTLIKNCCIILIGLNTKQNKKIIIKLKKKKHKLNKIKATKPPATIMK